MNDAPLFQAPELWPLVLLAPLAWGLLSRGAARRERALSKLLGTRAAAHDQRNPQAERIRRGLFCGGLLFAALATMRPSLGEEALPVGQDGIDVVVCVDVSRSMLAGDVQPSRLSRAQEELRALARRARGDRFALVAFAGEARLISPLTTDLGSFVDLARDLTPSTVELGGTDLQAALSSAFDALPEVPDSPPRAILLITDGEDHGGRGLATAELLRDQGLSVHCFGLGTERGSRIAVPTRGADGRLSERFLRSNGDEVVTTLDASGLHKIAASTGGGYADLDTSRQPLVTLYEDSIRPTARRAARDETNPTLRDRFQWPLGIALLLLLIELLFVPRTGRGGTE